MEATRGRSALKAITWRATGTADTFLIAWIITGKPLVAGSIATLEVLTKTFLYYFHERLWNLSNWGRG